jgi:hypothetical protein
MSRQRWTSLAEELRVGRLHLTPGTPSAPSPLEKHERRRRSIEERRLYFTIGTCIRPHSGDSCHASTSSAFSPTLLWGRRWRSRMRGRSNNTAHRKQAGRVCTARDTPPLEGSNMAESESMTTKIILAVIAGVVAIVVAYLSSQRNQAPTIAAGANNVKPSSSADASVMSNTVAQLPISGGATSLDGPSALPSQGIRISFTEVPPPGQGTNDTGLLSGRVTGASSLVDDVIVLYAHTNDWYVQPTTDDPYTDISSNGSWTNTIKRGHEYAALLVHKGYRPPAKTATLPHVGGDILMSAQVGAR